MQRQLKLSAFSFFKPVRLVIFLFPVLFIGCSRLIHDRVREDCKIRTYLNAPVLEYLTTQYGSEKSARFAVVPFDTPAGFSRWGKDEPGYGQQLASKFQLEMQKTGELGLVELFNLESWPGKREEFFKGNYGALERVRKAGYEMVLLGLLTMPKGPDTLVLYTKVIDAQNGVTSWSAETTLHTYDREDRAYLASWGLVDDKPAEYDFSRRTDALVECTMKEMFKSADIEAQQQEERETKKRVTSGALDDSM